MANWAVFVDNVLHHHHHQLLQHLYIDENEKLGETLLTELFNTTQTLLGDPSTGLVILLQSLTPSSHCTHPCALTRAQMRRC